MAEREMTDKELLELAAKAAGYKLHIWGIEGCENVSRMDTLSPTRWNPLENDADAFQLMVKLNLAVEVCKEKTMVFYDGFDAKTTCTNAFDKADAARRAIVMAAAEIGKGM
jgi:hypothetical protein